MTEAEPRRETHASLHGSAPDDLDLLVVGAGVSGLTLAREVGIRRPDWNVLVLEAADQPGGTMRSERVRGCLCEWGPNGFLTNVSNTLDLAAELGLEPRLLRADDIAQNRYLWVRGALRAVPTGPRGLLTSAILSPQGRLRVLLEPFQRAPTNRADESVHEFASRRIGTEAATVLIDAMVSGVFAGDSTKLSVEAAFPVMVDMERNYGSLVRAMIAGRRKRGRGGPGGPSAHALTTFDEGMEVLIDGLHTALQGRVRTGAHVVSLSPDSGAHRVSVTANGSEQTVRARRVVLATPAHVSAPILNEHYPRIARTLDGISYAGVSVACLIYERHQISHPLNGFGFLVPRGEGPRMLGCIWVGSIFPVHVSGDRVLMRAMMGGARDPEGAMLPEGRTVDLVHTELDRILGGITGTPLEARVFRHAKGIPQYGLGHLDLLADVDRFAEEVPGLYLAGNAYRGIGVNDCVRESKALADHITSTPLSGAKERVGAGEERR